MSDNGKTVIIGLDGATYRVLQPLIDAGVMPTIERFMRDGAWGNLMTTHPLVTCPAWPSMFTGVNPGQHGVFSFSYRDQQSGIMRTAASGDVKAGVIWAGVVASYPDLLTRWSRRRGEAAEQSQPTPTPRWSRRWRDDLLVNNESKT